MNLNATTLQDDLAHLEVPAEMTAISQNWRIPDVLGVDPDWDELSVEDLLELEDIHDALHQAA